MRWVSLEEGGARGGVIDGYVGVRGLDFEGAVVALSNVARAASVDGPPVSAWEGAGRRHPLTRGRLVWGRVEQVAELGEEGAGEDGGAVRAGRYSAIACGGREAEGAGGFAATGETETTSGARVVNR